MKYLICSITCMLCFSAKAQQLKVTYLANEGVLIESNQQKVMVDALFDDYYKDYLSPTEEQKQLMYAKSDPFQKVDLVLTTHIHRDHYEAQIAGAFMKAHDESKMVSSNQVNEDLKEKFEGFEGIASQIVAHERDLFTIREEVNGVLLYAFFINHAGGDRTANIENMGFIFELDGKRILHLGDSDMKIDRFKAVDLTQYNVDVALVPYWYMADETGRKIIDEHIKPKNLIGIHFPKAGSPLALEEVAKHYPEAKVFQKSMTSVDY